MAVKLGGLPVDSELWSDAVSLFLFLLVRGVLESGVESFSNLAAALSDLGVEVMAGAVS